MSSAVRTEAPAAEPLSLSVVKGHLRLEDLDAHDELLQKIYIPSARHDVEYVTQRALITQTWQLRLPCFPASGPIRLPWPPLQSVTSIQYVDSNGTTQTWDSSNYDVDTYSTPGCIEPVYGGSYPTARAQRNAVTIEYIAGYGSAGSAVPADIRNALLLIIADRYAQPENSPMPGENFAIELAPKPAQLLLSPYILPVF